MVEAFAEQLAVVSCTSTLLSASMLVSLQTGRCGGMHERKVSWCLYLH